VYPAKRCECNIVARVLTVNKEKNNRDPDKINFAPKRLTQTLILYSDFCELNFS
jgi:hypothetical protein